MIYNFLTVICSRDYPTIPRDYPAISRDYPTNCVLPMEQISSFQNIGGDGNLLTRSVKYTLVMGLKQKWYQSFSFVINYQATTSSNFQT